MRSGIQRYLVSAPYNRKIDLHNDKEFMVSNHVYDGMLKKMKREGKDKTQHKEVIEEQDIAKCYSTETFSSKNPIALQRKVFF